MMHNLAKHNSALEESFRAMCITSYKKLTLPASKCAAPLGPRMCSALLIRGLWQLLCQGGQSWIITHFYESKSRLERQSNSAPSLARRLPMETHEWQSVEHEMGGWLPVSQIREPNCHPFRHRPFVLSVWAGWAGFGGKYLCVHRSPSLFFQNFWQRGPAGLFIRGTFVLREREVWPGGGEGTAWMPSSTGREARAALFKEALMRSANVASPKRFLPASPDS